MTKADFDQELANVAALSGTANTPANREKLRKLGWRLIQAQKRQLLTPAGLCGRV
jgi:hypothetical protein